MDNMDCQSAGLMKIAACKPALNAGNAYKSQRFLIFIPLILMLINKNNSGIA